MAETCPDCGKFFLYMEQHICSVPVCTCWAFRRSPPAPPGPWHDNTCDLYEPKLREARPYTNGRANVNETKGV